MGLSQFGEKLELRSEVEISVDPRELWTRLWDFPAHGRWNPFWCHFEGRVGEGARIAFDLTPPGGNVLRVQRKVQVFLSERELAWTGRYGWGLILRGDQFFRLTDTGQGRTRLVVGENLRGPGVTGGNEIVLAIARGQALMNQSLKRYLESGS